MTSRKELHVRLREGTHHALRILKVLEGRSMSSVVQDALDEYLEDELDGGGRGPG